MCTFVVMKYSLLYSNCCETVAITCRCETCGYRYHPRCSPGVPIRCSYVDEDIFYATWVHLHCTCTISVHVYIILMRRLQTLHFKYTHHIDGKFGGLVVYLYNHQIEICQYFIHLFNIESYIHICTHTHLRTGSFLVRIPQLLSSIPPPPPLLCLAAIILHPIPWFFLIRSSPFAPTVLQTSSKPQHQQDLPILCSSIGIVHRILCLW